LASEGANVNAMCEDGTIALLVAVREERLPVVKALLDAGADPNLRAEGELTCLMVAIDTGNAEMVGLLLRAGADPRALAKNGLTAAQRGFNCGPGPIRELLQAAESEDHRSTSDDLSADDVSVGGVPFASPTESLRTSPHGGGDFKESPGFDDPESTLGSTPTEEHTVERTPGFTPAEGHEVVETPGFEPTEGRGFEEMSGFTPKVGREEPVDPVFSNFMQLVDTSLYPDVLWDGENHAVGTQGGIALRRSLMLATDTSEALTKRIGPLSANASRATSITRARALSGKSAPSPMLPRKKTPSKPICLQ
jgi:hypothetical protein